MANIQLYEQPIENYYSQDQINELEKPLDTRLIKTRKEGWRTLQYIEGHTAIDQANRIFGYGNWGWRVLSCELENIIDPVSGEGVGAIYHSRVEVWIRGMGETIIDVGSQPVSVSSVEEQIISRRIQDAEKAKRPVDESPFTLLEKKNARAVIVQAHEQARKGAGTDGLKRGLRGLGNQFANGLYGDGQVNLEQPATTVEAGKSRKVQKPVLDDKIKERLNVLYAQAIELRLFPAGINNNEMLASFFKYLGKLVNASISHPTHVTDAHLDSLEKEIKKAQAEPVEVEQAVS